MPGNSSQAGMVPAILEVMTIKETKNNGKFSVDTGRKEKAPCIDCCFMCYTLFCMSPGFSAMRNNYLQRSQNLLKLSSVQCTSIGVGLLLSFKLALFLIPFLYKTWTTLGLNRAIPYLSPPPSLHTLF